MTMLQSPAAPDTTFNGWSNYETWNVALYIQNEYAMYQQALRYKQQCERLDEPVDYCDFADILGLLFGSHTGDGVAWTDTRLDTDELDELLMDL